MTESSLLDPMSSTARMSTLARQARVDALAILSPTDTDFDSLASFNVPPAMDWLALAMLLDTSDGTTKAMAASQPLADGRTADHVVVAPLSLPDRRGSALVGLKVGDAPTDEDLAEFFSVAEAISAEMTAPAPQPAAAPPTPTPAPPAAPVARPAEAPAPAAQSTPDEDRAQAILLYELARFALGHDPVADLENATAMLSDALRHEAVGIWTVDRGSLRLQASSGYGGVLPHDVALDQLDPAMRKAFVDHEIARASFGASEDRPDWAAYGATHFLLAPLRERGALVLGRAAREHTSAEGDFAYVVADFLGAMLEPRGATAGGEPAIDVAGRAAERERTISEERVRFAQELHDGLAQELTGLVLGLESALRAIAKDSSLAAKQLARSVSDARGTLLEVRRYMAALRQTEGGDAVDLPVLLARLIDDLKRQTGLEVDVDESGLRAETDRGAERALLRIIGESLRNVALHSGATRAKVSVEYRPERLTATIQDDGKGFDQAKVLARAEGEGHFGILGMRERAEGLGGEVVIRSEIGRGTVVHATVPFDRSDGTVEDVEASPALEDTERIEPTARPRLLGLFKRR